MVDSMDYRKWLNRANQDFKVIKIIKQEGLEGLEDSFCYNCQQAVEKLFKTFLVKYAKKIPKTHDLVFLLNKCIQYEASLKEFADEVIILNEYSVSARYPNDFGEQRTVEEANEAFKIVKKIKEGIEVYIK